MSDWKESANERRDLRQAPAAQESGKKLGKKNTKRWCKGKVGVEHQPVCMPYAEAKPGSVLSQPPIGGDELFAVGNWRLLVCTVCGKELAHYYPARGSTKPKPPWVNK